MTDAATRAGRRRLRKQPHPPSHLPLGWRIFFIISGWVMVLVGIAGLALPGIQGVLTIVLGGALLSVASETAYWVLRWLFQRWPGGWRRVERMRRKLYRWIVGSAPKDG
ncbi:MAG TPA: PGPGW domain-containing protein [Thermoanaerobaculia bacterium]|nr:PGPGW domain-containing protein [Thermoanaerobaculia bacterium]